MSWYRFHTLRGGLYEIYRWYESDNRPVTDTDLEEWDGVEKVDTLPEKWRLHFLQESREQIEAAMAMRSRLAQDCSEGLGYEDPQYDEAAMLAAGEELDLLLRLNERRHRLAAKNETVCETHTQVADQWATARRLLGAFIGVTEAVDANLHVPPILLNGALAGCFPEDVAALLAAGEEIRSGLRREIDLLRYDVDSLLKGRC